MLTNAEIKNILLTTRTIARVGLSANMEKDSYWIVSYLQEQGYKIIPVNPGTPEILGEKSYPDLLSIPVPVDVVQVFRPAADVPAIAEQAIRIGAKVLWMQVGIVNKQAAKRAESAGLKVVMDACMRMAHRYLIGPKQP